MINVQSRVQGERRARKTITFTGAAGLGAVGTVTVWTVTGPIYMRWITSLCTVNLADAGGTATLSVGTASDTDAFMQSSTAVDNDAGEWLTGVAGSIGLEGAGAAEVGTTQRDRVIIAENVIITVATEAITGGALIFNCAWTPAIPGASLT